MTFSTDDALAAIDGAIMHLVTLRRVVEGVEDPLSALNAWLQSCPDSPQGSPHDVLWEKEGPRGMCRACGAEFDRQAAA